MYIPRPCATNINKMSVSVLRECAINGDVLTLFNVIIRDKLALQREEANSGENLLHISAMLGHTDFVKEILKLRPELVEGKNQRGSTPLHLACARGHTSTVNEILKVDAELCLERDGEGRNSLHVAVINGKYEVVLQILAAVPESATEVTEEGENLWHLSVKNNRVEIVKFLSNTQDLRGMAGGVDAKGNGVLHLAVARNLGQMVKLLISMNNNGILNIDVNTMNGYGLTPLDLCFELCSGSNEIATADTLLAAGATRSMMMNDPSASGVITNQPAAAADMDADTAKQEQIKKFTKELLVVAILIATVSFQGMIAPPGGFWQDTAESPTPAADPKTLTELKQAAHVAGNAVLLSPDYILYQFFNMMAFSTSLSYIAQHIFISAFSLRQTTCTLLTIFTAILCMVASAYCGLRATNVHILGDYFGAIYWLYGITVFIFAYMIPHNASWWERVYSSIVERATTRIDGCCCCSCCC